MPYGDSDEFIEMRNELAETNSKLAEAQAKIAALEADNTRLRARIDAFKKAGSLDLLQRLLEEEKLMDRITERMNDPIVG